MINLRNDANDDVSARASPRRAHRDDVAGGDDGSRLLVVVSPRAVDGDGDGAARTIGGSDDPAVVAVMPLESPMDNGAKKSKSLLHDGDQTDDEDEEDDEDLSTGVAA